MKSTLKSHNFKLGKNTPLTCSQEIFVSLTTSILIAVHFFTKKKNKQGKNSECLYTIITILLFVLLWELLALLCNIQGESMFKHTS